VTCIIGTWQIMPDLVSAFLPSTLARGYQCYRVCRPSNSHGDSWFQVSSHGLTL